MAKVELPLTIFQLYVDAPTALSVADSPTQISEWLEVINIVGKANTVKLEVAVFKLKQPSGLVPATVYDVVVVGLTTAAPP